MRQPTATILVADDEDVVLRMVTRALEGAGYAVLESMDGRETLEVFQRHQEHVDLVLLDLGMPRMSGYEALAELQIIDPDVKIIVITGLVADEDRLPGVLAVLNKPFLLDQLFGVVRDALDATDPS